MFTKLTTLLSILPRKIVSLLIDNPTFLLLQFPQISFWRKTHHLYPSQEYPTHNVKRILTSPTRLRPIQRRKFPIAHDQPPSQWPLYLFFSPVPHLTAFYRILPIGVPFSARRAEKERIRSGKGPDCGRGKEVGQRPTW